MPQEEMGEVMDRYQLTNHCCTQRHHERTMSETWQMTTAVDGRGKCNESSKKPEQSEQYFRDRNNGPLNGNSDSKQLQTQRTKLEARGGRQVGGWAANNGCLLTKTRDATRLQ